MTVFDPAEIVDAVAITSTGPFPLPETPEGKYLLVECVKPALRSLPQHLQCDVVAEALMTMFVMGLSAGAELGRRER